MPKRIQRTTMEPHSVWQGSFTLFSVDLQCHVLSDGRRIIEEDSMVDLLEAMKAPVEGHSDAVKLAEFCTWLTRR